MGELLATLPHRYALRLIPTPGLLKDSLARLERFDLALHLVGQRALNGAEGVHVFNLNLNAILLLGCRTDAHIRIAA